MQTEIDTKHTSAVEVAVRDAYRTMFPEGDRRFVTKVFEWTQDCFHGNYADYQPIDAHYHDLEHTIQGTLCLCRILEGRFEAKASPAVSQKGFELALLAILLHDTGYLKHRDDNEGTGAKYTLTHVNRSLEFAENLLKEKGFEKEDIKAVQNMIRCTGVNVNVQAIPFRNDLERVLGYCVGTADLLGQMAAKDYVPKLPILYLEFEESAKFNSGKMAFSGSFTSARDLMEKTPTFWEKYVLVKIEKDFEGMHRFLNRPYPDGQNLYLRKIYDNMAKLREALATEAA